MATITVDQIEIPANAHTLDGFRAWVASLGDDAPRVHFSSGRIHIEMSPQNYLTHGYLVKAINRVLEPLAEELGLGEYHVPPSWVTEAVSGLSTEPDGFLVRWESFRSGRSRIDPGRPTEMLGAPAMTLEVVSGSSEKKDLKILVGDYAAARVEEYWIADARAEEIVFRILLLEEDGAYRDQPVDPEGWIASPLWDRSFRLRRFTNPAGIESFRLETRPA